MSPQTGIEQFAADPVTLSDEVRQKIERVEHAIDEKYIGVRANLLDIQTLLASR